MNGENRKITSGEIGNSDMVSLESMAGEFDPESARVEINKKIELSIKNEYHHDDESGDERGVTNIEARKQIFEALDENFDVLNEGKYGIVGVIGGIKPATGFVVYARDGEEEEVSRELENILDGLGLKYEKEIEEFEDDSNYKEIGYYAAKDIQTVRRVKELVEESCEEGQTGDTTRELGRLFGFPETAIEYFIKRNRGEVQDNVDSKRKYSFYIHSPENGEEEYRQYEQRINKLFRLYCPHSAEELLGVI